MKKMHSRAAGFSLIEVMIAVVVLAFGLISLAALQGRLFQLGAESKARTAATAIAQQVLEDAHSFAFVLPPVAGYSGPTYISLASSASPWSISVGGVDFSVTRNVTRYRYDDVSKKFLAGSAAAFSAGVPEFKQVNVNVSWTGSDGVSKTVQLTDGIAAVAPADAAMLRKPPAELMDGPQVWIEPPNKDNPQVVPIGIGGDQSAASSNPKPEQFVRSDSAVTRFSVMTFSGDSDGVEVRLNRKLDVAAATCVCQEGGVSSAVNPTYQPTVWSGRQLAYVEPQALAAGAPVGTPVVANADSEIEPICTVCCRDHHENAKRKPRPDPYRALTSAEAGGNEHYGYKNSGDNLVDIGGGLFPSSETNSYVDSCQVIRVGGRLRMAVDAMQNNLLVTPLNAAKTGYGIDGFASSYAGYVTDVIKAGVAGLPTGYLSPTARFPAPSTGDYDEIVNPEAIKLVAGDNKSLVAFGLYIDYLSPETLKAYQCASTDSNTGDCAGLGGLEPLQVLPFYAVNVANLGSWTSAKPLVASVADATYSKGLLATDGGLVKAEKDKEADPFPVTIGINNSNSGLAGTNPVDPDDSAASSFVQDAQNFTKPDGTFDGIARTLSVQTRSSSIAITSLNILADGAPCSRNQVCNYSSPAASLTLQIGNYTTEEKIKGKPTIIDRKVCVAVDGVQIASAVPSGNGTLTDTTVIEINGPLTLDYTLTIDIVDEGATCTPVSPAITP